MRFPLHSFVDLITNSSSEVFVAADRQTVSALESIVDAILFAGGSTKKCTDLFRIGLDTEDGGYGHYKVIYVEARDPSCKKSAEALETIKDIFSIVYVDDGDDAISAKENAPKQLARIIDAVLVSGESADRCPDLFDIGVETTPPENKYDEQIVTLKVEPIRPGCGTASKLLNGLNTIFIAETVSSE